MKKEIVAAALLAALFAGVIINIRVSEKLALELTDEINFSEKPSFRAVKQTLP